MGCLPGATRDNTGWALLNDRILLVVKEEWSLAQVILDVCGHRRGTCGAVRGEEEATEPHGGGEHSGNAPVGMAAESLPPSLQAWRPWSDLLSSRVLQIFSGVAGP